MFNHQSFKLQCDVRAESEIEPDAGTWTDKRGG